ncbi:multicopper oxidase family protein [Helicobacter sp. WB40]|uniref:multicopper oxidase family protein n=1 Tax=Helicobacter sp. WB40 TaxID=3004130 RepID=UPI0022EBE375|nr:multicopper oxidase family protein [Helicobacter sp. WB40]MDA3967565.1 multicopper oxidase family protein [Helicobacter sp. WB40]
MNRRQFLQFNALSIASIGMVYATQSHNGHNMHNMNMGHMNHNPKNTKDIYTDFISLESENMPLLDASQIPQNQSLKKLQLLKNQSKSKNSFKAKIEIIEKELEIAKGKKTRFYTYNGLIPGPKIEVYEGDEVEIEVINHLNEETTIHWHGLEIPPEQDGNPHDPIKPHQSRIYKFTIPQNSAGTYWYHPHPHYITGKQVYMGLAGAFVVKAKQDSLSHLQEQDWIISDLRLDKNAQIPQNTLTDWLNGREGELVLINGQLNPQITIDKEQRIRIYNMCAARYLNLKIENAEFILVGTDCGLIEKPITKDTLFLSPASRVEIILKPTKQGESKLYTTYYDRDKMMVEKSQEPQRIDLATLSIKEFINTIPEILRELPKLKKATSTKEVVFSEDHMQMHGISKKTQEEIKIALASMFLQNGKTYKLDRIDLQSKVGEVETWIITNKSHMDHPFHIHGTHFEVISSTYQKKKTKPEFRALYDTINLRPGETLELQIVQKYKGLRMYHCHILEHEDLGMMGNLEVI